MSGIFSLIVGIQALPAGKRIGGREKYWLDRLSASVSSGENKWGLQGESGLGRPWKLGLDLAMGQWFSDSVYYVRI